MMTILNRSTKLVKMRVEGRIKLIFSRNTRQFLIFLCLFAGGSFLFGLSKDFATLYIYQERDLDRSFQLLNGQMIWHGPELTGGGFLPGNLYYLLLSGFLLINRDLISGWYGMLAMASLGGAAVWIFLNRRFGSGVGILWLLNYFGSPFNFIVISYFWNPSFSFLFILAALCAIIETFAFSGTRWSLALAFAFSALTVQLHLTGLILFGLLLFLHLSGRRLGLNEISNRNFYGALFLNLIWYLPYVVFRLYHMKNGFHGIAHQSENTNWINFLANEVIESWISHFKIHGLTSSTFELGLSLWIFVPISLLLFLPLKWLAKDRIESGRIQIDRSRVNTILIMTLAFSVCVAAPTLLSIGLFSKYRYGIIFILTLQIASSIWIGSFLRSHFSADRVQTFKWRLPIFFTLFLAGMLTYLYVPRYVEGRRAYAPSFFTLRAALQFVHDQTCWTPEQMKEKIFSLNIYSFIGWKLLNEVECANAAPNRNIKNAIFFIPWKSPSDSKDIFDSQEAIEEFKKLHLEGIFLKELEDGNLKLEKSMRFGKLHVALVSEKILNSAPPRFNNTGYPYSKAPLELHLKSAFSLANPILRVEPNSLLAKTSSCDGQTRSDFSYCRAGFLLKLSPSFDSPEVLTVSIFGEALSQPSFWIDPLLTSAWIAPFVEFKCRRKISKIILAEAIGFNMRHGWKLLNSTVLAPFSRVIEVPCPKSLTEIRLGAESRFFTSPWQETRRSGFKIFIPLENAKSLQAFEPEGSSI